MRFLVFIGAGVVVLLAGIWFFMVKTVTVKGEEVKGAEELREERFGEHRRFIASADSIKLFSVATPPRKGPLGEEILEYQTYGKVEISDRGVFGKVADDLYERVYGGQGNWMVACFSPRHCLKVVKAEQQRWFLICFQCSQIRIYGVDETDDLGSINLKRKVEPSQLLNTLLDEAGIPREPSPSAKAGESDRS